MSTCTSFLSMYSHTSPSSSYTSFNHSASYIYSVSAIYFPFLMPYSNEIVNHKVTINLNFTYHISDIISACVPNFRTNSHSAISEKAA